MILASPSPERPASLLRRRRRSARPPSARCRSGIAGETGGFVTTVEPGENLTTKFRRVLEDFRSSYVLYFTPRGVDRAGAHTLEVRVKRPGVDVRARRGYVWR